MNKSFSIKSPTHGDNYTIKNGLEKFLARRNFKTEVDLDKIRLVEEYQWNGLDGDYVVPFRIETYSSLWNDNTADFILEGNLPAHCSGEGRFELGFASQEDPDQKNSNYLEPSLDDSKFIISCILDEEIDEIEFTYKDLDEDEIKILFDIFKQIVFQVLGFMLVNRWSSKHPEAEKNYIDVETSIPRCAGEKNVEEN
jgi:hypothetical protein